MRSFSSSGLILPLSQMFGLGPVVLEEALVVVPRGFGGAFGQTRHVVGVGDELAAAAGGNFGEQGEIQTLHRLAAFGGHSVPMRLPLRRPEISWQPAQP